MLLNPKIMVVGDIHGDWGRLNKLINKKQPDIVLQVGDFGWWPSMEINAPILYGQQRYDWKLKGVKPGNAKVYFCDGNHEEYSKLPLQDGKIHKMYEGVYYASRGSVLVLPDGRRVLFAGGASSIDKGRRTPGRDWFPEENISQIDYERMIAHEKIDIVISHTCPTYFDMSDTKKYGKMRDGNRSALSFVMNRYNPSLWYFGHWHTYKEGVYYDEDTGKRTIWFCLDYPGHKARWWKWLDE